MAILKYNYVYEIIHERLMKYGLSSGFFRKKLIQFELEFLPEQTNVNDFTQVHNPA